MILTIINRDGDLIVIEDIATVVASTDKDQPMSILFEKDKKSPIVYMNNKDKNFVEVVKEKLNDG